MAHREADAAASAGDEQNWAELYGQPKKPVNVDDWSPWMNEAIERRKTKPSPEEEPELLDLQDEAQADSGREAASDKENEYSAEAPKCYRRKKSKSRSPTKATRATATRETATFSSNFVYEGSNKRWSRPPPPADDTSFCQAIYYMKTFFMLMILVVCSGGLYYTVAHGYYSGRVHRPSLMPAFDQKLAELKLQFPSQPTHNWKVIRAAFAEVLNHSQYQHGPAVLVILASDKEQHLSSCFAEKLAFALAKTFDSAERPIQLSGAKLNRTHDPMAAKHTIDSTVKGRDNFVMEFESLEQIDSYTASIFHSLCDYYNSPFSRAIFIFTVHTPEETGGRHRREYDKIADQVLNNAWQDLDDNKRSALIARLTGSTILLRKESRRVC